MLQRANGFAGSRARVNQRPFTATRWHSNPSRVQNCRKSVRVSAVDLVGPATAMEKIEAGLPYLDVRTEEEFQAGHPPGALNIPFMLRSPAGMVPNDDFLEQVVAQFPEPDQPIVVGCKSGNRSGRACALLQQRYESLADVAGGWDRWIAEGLPEERA